ncbi:5-oxoprolinase isoform X2 [Ahaetulla prasina]|uniref:5-oxoprolinase isoform X2 n=1 Tax=Ahaetulla prasina TaxID=499056 RepID=UPI002649DA45|nr:5-oxoprolinase isoform X2 [Ahaetulla prasina]
MAARRFPACPAPRREGPRRRRPWLARARRTAPPARPPARQLGSRWGGTALLCGAGRETEIRAVSAAGVVVCPSARPLALPSVKPAGRSAKVAPFAMAAPLPAKFQFAIDRGGTFTDVFARCPDGKIRVMKLLSEDPANYRDAPTEGIRRILQEECGVPFPKDQPLKTTCIEWIRMGTTVATNALLERKGERFALLITKGFRDLLYIGNQARPSIFDLEVRMPEVLYEAVVEVDERLVVHRDGCPLFDSGQCVTGVTGESLVVKQPVNLLALRAELEALLARGIRGLAVVLLHSYLWPGHEQQVGALARELGFQQISLSSEVMPMVRVVPRGYTACIDAYLTPCILRYLQSFRDGFASQLQGVPVAFMRSDGGLTPMETFSGSRAILSGPAGGVVGYAVTSYHRAEGRPVIGFDMGGTSTDVSRYAGEYEHVFEATTAGISIQVPQLDINTVAAGGGSRLFFRSGLFVVGPESAGAFPGPACYRKGGPLTVTDANLCLGRLLPSHFPHIFGPDEKQPLSHKASLQAFQALTDEVKASGEARPDLSVEEVAMGFILVANEAMCRPIRALTQARGHDTSRHILACFGGAGGQHASAIARALGMSTVFIHKHSGVLSAYGMALADIVHEAQEPCSLVYEPASFAQLDLRMAALEKTCVHALEAQGFARSQITTEAFLHLRYQRTDCALMCSAKGYPAQAGTCSHGDFGAAFANRYQQEFGFTIPKRAILVDDVRVRGTACSGMGQEEPQPVCEEPPNLEMMTRCYFEGGYQDTPVYLLENLFHGHSIPGPSILMDKNSTILVEPGCTASVTALGDICIAVGSGAFCPIGPELDPVQLSIFSHRFMSIAEQMGRVLQRTAISTNIKERLDFSCALFGPDGGLVSNAPHIPVHLGAMQETVQFQIQHLGPDLRKGDVILSNHPCAGGSHLPDLTVITPVFWEKEPKAIFFVASRGHHADIGGITPGSMPPHSHSLQEEGAIFISFKLVKEGIFQEEAITTALLAPGQWPGSSGTRNLHDNLSDLRAQVAANQRGIQLVNELIGQYGLGVVQAYMGHIQANAEVAVQTMLRKFATRHGHVDRPLQVEAKDFMDDGTPICLRVTVDPQESTAVFDFTGTGQEVYGNWNAPRAITLSALIYCLRCMVGEDIPLNQGCLSPVRIVVPESSILHPSLDAGVVGGNVLTSQRVVDVIFRAFEVCAASQGCMNNVTFGNEHIGYYETVAGGAGAGPHWHGRSGVHSHMTNTRITDPEILEKRPLPFPPVDHPTRSSYPKASGWYPVVLRTFQLAPNTGGAGLFRGGSGVRRELQFREEMVLSVLSERRAFQPYGLQGGDPGSPGLNLLIQHNGRTMNLGGKMSVEVHPGDVFCLQSPGGGGFGRHPQRLAKGSEETRHRAQLLRERGSFYYYSRSQEMIDGP